MADVGVDTSFYQHPANPAAPLDPLSSLEKIANTQNALNVGKMFQLQLDYRKAIGPILQGSIGEDGELDYPKAVLAMSKNPATAPFATQFLQEALTRQSTQQDVIKKQMENAITRNGAIGNVGANLTAEFRDNPGAMTQAHVMGRLGELMATSPEIFGRNATEQRQRLMQIAASLPPDGKPVAGWTQQYADMAQGAEKTLAQVYGSASTVGTGGEENVLVTSPRMRTSVNVGSLPVTPTPESRNATQQVTNPVTGDENAAARQEVAPMFNGRGQVMPGTGVPANALMPGAQPTAPGAPSGLPLAPNAAGPATPQGGVPATAPAPPASTPAPRPITKLGPYSTTNFADMGKYRDDLNKTVETGNRTMLLLNNFQEAMQHFETGPGMEWRKEAAQAASAAGLDSLATKLVGGDTKQALAAAQQFEMLRIQDAVGQMKSLIGTGQRYTNTEFKSISDSVANISTDPTAIVKVANMVRNLHGVNVMFQQKLATWEQDHPGVPITRAPATFAKAFDSYLQQQYNRINPAKGVPVMEKADLFAKLPR